MTSHAVDKTLSEPTGPLLPTRSGMMLATRRVTAGDAAALGAFFAELSPEDMRFRFLSARPTLSPDQLSAMINVDHRHSEHLLAFDSASGRLVASLLVAADEGMDSAEVAIAVHPEFKALGIGWSLLNHAAQLARERGLRRLCAIESRDNHRAIEIERALGFRVSEYEGDPALLLVEADLG